MSYSMELRKPPSCQLKSDFSRVPLRPLSQVVRPLDRSMYRSGFKKPNEKATADRFKNLVVKSPDGRDVLLSDYWQRRPIVLKILARLSCAMCKQEASTISEMQPYLDQHGVGVVAVAFEDVDLVQFLKNGYWNWDILIDHDRKAYEAAGLYRLTIPQLLRDTFCGRIFPILTRLFFRGLTNPIKSDPRQLGGTYVISPTGDILYEFRASRLAMFPSAKEIYSAIGGNPDEIEEDVPESYIYTQTRAASLYSRYTI